VIGLGLPNQRKKEKNQAQDSFCPPPVDGETSLHHHRDSYPHAGSLGTTRSSDLTEMICAPSAEHEWLVRGPGIGSHIGRRARDGHLKGPGPNQI